MIQKENLVEDKYYELKGYFMNSKPVVIVIAGPTASRENIVIYRTCKENKWRNNFGRLNANI